MYEPARLSYEDIRGYAERFLDEYHPDRSLPVPIEEIAEFDFDLEIRPLEGIKDDLDVDAFLSWTRRRLFIDEFVFIHYRSRARFSIAHELAHHQLHTSLYESVEIRSPQDFLHVQEAIGPEDYRWFEWQAYTMAGLVLVPTDHLRDAFSRTVREAVSEGLEEELVLSDVGIPYVIRSLAVLFDVSTKCVEKRLDKEGLWRPTGGFDSLNP